LVFFILSFGLGGCGHPLVTDAKTAPVFGYRNGEDIFYSLALLDETARRFLALPPASTPSAEPSATTGGTGQGGVGPVSLGGSVDYDIRHSSEVSLGVVTTLPVTPRLAVEGRVAFAYGQSLYVLPEGIDILTDPIDIDLQSRSLEAELGLRLRQPLWGKLAGYLSAGAGRRIARADMSLTSALLDTGGQITEHQDFFAVGAGVDLPVLARSRAALGTAVKHYPGIGTSLLLGVDISLR
jgi:hypothetical protein|tara:strand:+ start:2188 stop:2904 length:717 start_codon:yes stop_codon:yes gene_type:complete